MDRERAPSRWGTEVLNIDDMLMSILVWLPAKHLLRFQVVDSRWRGLISDRKFKNCHARHHCRRRTSETAFIIRTQSRFFYFNPTTRAFVPFNFTISHTTKILQSRHGLMLLEYSRKRLHYCVHNPTTGKSRKLSIVQDGSVLPFFLDYDPSKSEYYKVGFLRVVHLNPNESTAARLDVYDSKTEKWKRTTYPAHFHIPESLIEPNKERIFLKNRVYCARSTGKTHYMDPEKREIGRIHSASSFYERAFVMEWNENLYCIGIYLQNKEKWLYVHKLEDSLVWSEPLWVELNPVQFAWPEMEGHITVLGMVGGSTLEDRSILFNVVGKIVSYRVRDNSFEVLFDSGTGG